MPVPLLTQTDDFAIQGVESSKQRGGPIALVIVRHGSGPSAFDWQARLRTVQGLNLTLLVAAQHQGVLGRIQIQTDDGHLWAEVSFRKVVRHYRHDPPGRTSPSAVSEGRAEPR